MSDGEREPISGSSRDYGTTAAVPNVGFAGFSPTELENLSKSIGDNISTLNSGLHSLEKMMKQIGSLNDNLQLREKIHNTQQSVNSSVSTTARDIQRLGVLVRRGDKPQKLQVERLTQAFRDGLSKYSSVQKEVTQKMAAHMPKSGRINNKQAVADDQESLIEIEKEQTQVRLQQHEISLMQDREAYVRQIETDVLDVNEILHNLAELTHQQGEKVDSIAVHIEEAQSDVQAGTEQTAKSLAYAQQYRKKMFILILIGIVFGIVFVVWIIKAFK